MRTAKLIIALVAFGLFLAMPVAAQERFPEDNGLWTYHAGPKYRESESHPLRVVGYILHPIGWVAREAIFRPLSYFASSTRVTRSVMGYRDPFDFRKPTCFSSDDSVPNCHALMPYNYGQGDASGVSGDSGAGSMVSESDRQVYFPDVNFNFNSRKLTDLGEGRTRQIAQLLNSAGGLKIVLEGHADFKGTDAYNEKLGMDRSETVRQRLLALGVNADRLSSVTFGESKPVFSEQEDWARAVNRRVSVHVSDSGEGATHN